MSAKKLTTKPEDAGFGFFDDGPAASNEPAAESPVCGDCINLGYELTISNVAEIKQRIEASMANSGKIRLDPSELKKIDASGLQMLYSLQKTLARSSQQLLWCSRNPVLDSASELIGMSCLIDATSTTSSDQNQGFGFF